MNLFIVVFFLIAFGDLSIFFLDFIDFGNIDECNVLLSVDLLEFETFVDRAVSGKIDSLFYEGQLDLFFLAVLPHYYFIMVTISILQ